MLGATLSPTTWLPFGGGNRRCLGAGFAMVEMRVVLREVLRRVELHTTAAAGERQKLKHVITVPQRGAQIRVEAIRDVESGAIPGRETFSKPVAVELARSDYCSPLWTSSSTMSNEHGWPRYGGSFRTTSLPRCGPRWPSTGLEFQGGELSAFRRKIGTARLVRSELAHGVRWPGTHRHASAPADERVRILGVPGPDLTVTSVAPMIMRHGTEQNKKEFLPGIARGEIVCAAGYDQSSSPAPQPVVSCYPARDARRRRLGDHRIQDLEQRCPTVHARVALRAHRSRRPAAPRDLGDHGADRPALASRSTRCTRGRATGRTRRSSATCEYRPPT